MSEIIPVKVALRIRPLSQKEKLESQVECLRIECDRPQVTVNNQKNQSFCYDYTFPPKTCQIDVYETCVKPLLNCVFQGYNATVFAYGPTGSGKTYTMGSTTSNLMVNDVGVIPRVIHDLFSRMEDNRRLKKDQVKVKVSFLQVYNEIIKDLLNLKLSTSESLEIREENNTMGVANLSRVEVDNAFSTMDLLKKGLKQRIVGGNGINGQSSRSHAVFTIHLEQLNGNNLIKSKFHLVDLAGTERSKTNADTQRLKEGININLGLLALKNVIDALKVVQEMPNKHVPYRESKLTRLLQDSLGGNSHTVMIACVSPAYSNIEETLNTLKFAFQVRHIKNNPHMNSEPHTAKSREQIQQLEANLYPLTDEAHTGSSDLRSTEMLQVEENYEKLKSENTILLTELQQFIKLNDENEKRNKKLEQELQTIKQERDKLINQNAADTESFLRYQQEKEKEVNDLKAKLQEGDCRPKARVLDGKKKEFHQIQRLLKETLEKQKQVSEKRKQAFDCQDSSTFDDEFKAWLAQEIDLSVNIAEAKISLNKLIEDRNDSSRELVKVKDKLDELIDKRKYLSDIDQTNSQFREHGHNLNDLLKIIQLKEEIERINEKIECKSIQINDIQQMILEADKYEKIKHLFNNIDNIPEAKLVLKEVYNRCVECLLDSKLKQIEYNTSSNEPEKQIQPDSDSIARTSKSQIETNEEEKPEQAESTIYKRIFYISENRKFFKFSCLPFVKLGKELAKDSTEFKKIIKKCLNVLFGLNFGIRVRLAGTTKNNDRTVFVKFSCHGYATSKNCEFRGNMKIFGEGNLNICSKNADKFDEGDTCTNKPFMRIHCNSPESCKCAKNIIDAETTNLDFQFTRQDLDKYVYTDTNYKNFIKNYANSVEREENIHVESNQNQQCSKPSTEAIEKSNQISIKRFLSGHDDKPESDIYREPLSKRPKNFSSSLALFTFSKRSESNSIIVIDSDND